MIARLLTAALGNPWLLIATGLAACALALALYLGGMADGKAKVEHRLKDDRIEMLSQGKDADDEAAGADDDGLCSLLGGC